MENTWTKKQLEDYLEWGRFLAKASKHNEENRKRKQPKDKTNDT